MADYFRARLSHVFVRASEGDTYDRRAVSTVRVNGDDDGLRGLMDLLVRLEGPERLVEAWLYPKEDDRNLHHPLPVVHLYGDRLEGVGRVRRRAPVVISFGRRGAWTGGARFDDGSVLQPALLLGGLLHLCRTTRPSGLDLLSDGESDLPTGHHFVYRADASGFAKDLTRSIIRMDPGVPSRAPSEARRPTEPCWLHGAGRSTKPQPAVGRADGSRRMIDRVNLLQGSPATVLEPAHGPSTATPEAFGRAEPWDVAARTGDNGSHDHRRLADAGARLKAKHFVPERVHGAVETTLCGLDSTTFAEMDDGLAVWHTPILEGNLEAFYFNLLKTVVDERVAGIH
jgi:hypothetical protein